MKSIFHLFALATLLMVVACKPSSQSASHPEGMVLNLQITGLPDGTQMEICLGATGQPESPLQSCLLVDGKAQFSFDVEGPRMYYISAAGTYGMMPVVMDKGQEATLTATATTESRSGSEKPFVRYTDQQVSGSSLQEEFIRRRVDRDALDKDFQALQLLTDKEEKAKAEKAFFAKVDSTFKATFRASADSWWGPMLVLHSYSYVSEQNVEEYNYFTDEVKESYYGRLLHDKIWPPSMEGKQVPDFRFTNHADGKQMSLKVALAGKKYLLLDFWASWCKPCRKEIPNILNLYKKYHDKGFEVVSISADSSEAAWKKALDEEQLPWYNDRDGNQGICTLYKVQYYPTLYLLDASGRVVAKDLRGEELAAKLAELFQ